MEHFKEHGIYMYTVSLLSSVIQQDVHLLGIHVNREVEGVIFSRTYFSVGTMSAFPFVYHLYLSYT